MKRILIGLGVLVAIVIVVFVVARERIALSLMERTIAQRMATNAMAELPDGLHVALCGAGSPMPDADRSGPCTAVIAGDLTVGQLVAFNMLSGRVTGPILRLAQLWNDFQQARISVERLGDILNTPTEPQYNPNRATLKDIEGNVVFENVTFRYPSRPDLPALEEVALDIRPGEKVALVGPSGAGKSTLFQLLLRFRDPDAGRILIGGEVVRGTVSGLSDAEIAAYDAPFPDESYKAGARAFPSLVPITPDDPAAPAQKDAWASLKRFDKPFLTCFSDKDPIMKGGEEVFKKLVPGAAKQEHFITREAGHFLQEDAGPYLARKMIEFIRST